jgi:aspartate kinase
VIDSTIVMKFGGTSVGDADAIRRVTSIVRQACENPNVRPFVVVSAMAGVTDRLLGIASTAAGGNRAAAVRDLHDVHQRHIDAVGELIGADHQPSLVSELARVVDDLQAILTSLAVLREASPRSLDAVSAAGELLSSLIVAGALREAGLDVAWVDARRVLVTDDGYPAAPILHQARAALAHNVVPQMAAGRVPVVGGFVGATTAGVTTTLGRGGSDYSAAVFGAALAGQPLVDGTRRLECREIQIWTDVDGMLTADPRVVKNPIVVPRLSFAEASELAYFGAKVLHPSTILPAVAADIPVRILNSRKPDGDGTLITSAASTGDRPIAALACKRHVTVVEITSTRMLMAHGFLRRLFQVFESHRTAVDVVTTSEVSVSVTVDDDRNLAAIVRDLEEFAEVAVEKSMAILCAVGDNLRGDPRLAIRVLAALEGVPLRMVSQAGSRRNLTVVLHERDLVAAMSRLHNACFVEAGISTAG